MRINEVFKSAFHSDKRYLILWGSAGSGKSWFAAQKIIFRTLTETGHRFLVCRKVSRTLRESCFKLIKETIIAEGLTSEFDIRETDMHIRCKRNGNEIVFTGLDDVEKLKSIVSPSSIWCEEPTEFTETDFSQIELRMRGETDNYKQFIMSFNPIDEDHWIKARFFEREDEQVLPIHANYNTNAFLDADYIHHLEQRMKFNENMYRVYVKGEWGRATYGGEFYKCFKFSKHIIPNPRLNGHIALYKASLPLHISFDFNVNPYMTLTVWQVEGKKAIQIDEICAPNPNNTTPAICREFVRLYNNHPGGLLVYGDPAGEHEDTRVEKRTEQKYNDFVLIRNELVSFRPSLRTESKAPPVVMRANFINSIFDNNYEGCQILIGDNCKNSIKDLQYLKEASDGRKHKEKQKDEATGVTSEKYGHTSDSMDYFICSVFRNEFNKYQRGTISTPITQGKTVSAHDW